MGVKTCFGHRAVSGTGLEPSGLRGRKKIEKFFYYVFRLYKVCKHVGEVGAIILVCGTCPGVVGKLVKLGPEVEVGPKNRKKFYFVFGLYRVCKRVEEVSPVILVYVSARRTHWNLEKFGFGQFPKWADFSVIPSNFSVIPDSYKS